MEFPDAILPIKHVTVEPGAHMLAAEGLPEIRATYKLQLDWDSGTTRDASPDSTVTRHSDRTVLARHFTGLQVETVYTMPEDRLWLDERVTLTFESGPARLSDIYAGMVLDRESLRGFTATPVPFRVGLDGTERTLELDRAEDGAWFAEGWVLDNGRHGLLVMRVPTGSAYTCFVPLVINADGVQVGSVGPDGEDHRERSTYLDTDWPQCRIESPATRLVFFRGDWRTGYEVFRQMIRASLQRTREPRKAPCPITYNTYHDFGPSYDKGRLLEIMPRLARMGFGMIHLDPGWETVWGSNVWNTPVMGEVGAFVKEARDLGLEVGCWTSVHTTDPDVHGDGYALDREQRKYYAEDFTIMDPSFNRLWGVCPASAWKNRALESLSMLGSAGVRFLNSDFHDWPWFGESCWNTEHDHRRPLTRAEWAEALNSLYEDLHKACPEMVIELHDHVESGAYRTPVWYLYDRPFSYDEKWAYEFMWKTYQDLMDRKLFSLYYLRLAEPIPLYLHINASSDNENALAFWYVASCVTHIGVGAIMRSSDEQRAAYAKAFEQYNARFDAFALGEFHGIDELTHVHVYPDRKRAVLLAFNLEDEAVEREISIHPRAWGMSGAITEERLKVQIGPKNVTLVDLPTGL